MDKLLNWLISAFHEARGAIVTAAIVALVGAVWKSLRNRESKKSSRVKQPDKARQRGRYALLYGTLFLCIWAVWNEIVGPRLSSYFIRTDIATLVHNHRWITYNPLHFNPYSSPNPNIDTVRKEVRWIRNAGFDGIITFSSQSNFAEIPELAKKEGLSVIMGVWNPMNRQEVAAAISKRDYVDAYCVGHDGLDSLYSYSELMETIRHVRFRTGRAVSTTEKLGRYMDDKRLLQIGDWLFPDVHFPITPDEASTFIANAVKEGERTIEKANLLAHQDGRDGRPILLKMVTYPMNGLSNATLEEQAYFFRRILKTRRDVIPEVHSDVSISVHSAFDLPWKIGSPFYTWDPFTGLLENDGSSRPAVREIVDKLP